MIVRSQVEATTDSLTGLANRRRLVADLEQIADEATLLLLDLDGFKSYNDTFGHLAGDALLDRLGTALSRSLDGRATAYRMGGDEFCVLSVARAGQLGLAAVAAGALRESGDGFEITSSYGIVSLPGRGRRHDGGAPARRLADVRAEAAASFVCREPEQERAPAGAPGAQPDPRRPRLRRRRSGRRDRSPARPRRQRSRLPQPRRGVARRRQGRDPGRDPREARPAAPERMGVRPSAHVDRRADHRRRAGVASGGARRSLYARAVGRPRVSGRSQRRARSRSSRGS